MVDEAGNEAGTDEVLIPTGEFAKLCGVKKQTLFHYDDIGLLPPTKVDDKGYRFYSFQQYETFRVIASLKETGMSLAEIKRFLADPSGKARMDAIEKACGRIDERIAYLSAVRRVFEEELDRVRAVEDAPIGAFSVEQLPAQDFIRSRMLEKLKDDELVRTVVSYSSNVEVACAALSVASITKGDFADYAFLLAKVPANRTMLPNRSDFVSYRRHGGTYVIGYHRGAYETAGETYGKMLSFIDEQGLQTGTYAFEEYLKNKLTAANPEEYLTRIIIEVKPRKVSARTQPVPQAEPDASSVV